MTLMRDIDQLASIVRDHQAEMLRENPPPGARPARRALLGLVLVLLFVLPLGLLVIRVW